MFRSLRWLTLPLASSLLFLNAGVALSESVALQPGFPEGITVSGRAGGSVASRDCGFISSQPNHTIRVSRGGLSYMRVYLESQGDATLLVQGPDGRYCADGITGANPQVAGPWPVGTYQIYVGSRQAAPNGGAAYQLRFTESRRR